MCLSTARATTTTSIRERRSVRHEQYCAESREGTTRAKDAPRAADGSHAGSVGGIRRACRPPALRRRLLPGSAVSDDGVRLGDRAAAFGQPVARRAPVRLALVFP